MLDKEKTKQNVNNVGVAVHGDPHFEELTKKQKGITLIALIITTIFSYDENVKSSNNKGFLLQTI